MGWQLWWGHSQTGNRGAI